MKNINLRGFFERKAYISLPLALAVISSDAAAECLKIDQSGVDVGSSDRPDLVTADWTAEVVNDCDVPYDGILQVQVFVAGGSVPREAVDFIVLQPGENQVRRGTINLAGDGRGEIEKTDFSIEERERPR